MVSGLGHISHIASVGDMSSKLTLAAPHLRRICMLAIATMPVRRLMTGAEIAELILPH
jgi:hypothetical protein